MPELPESETIRQVLEPQIKGDKIMEVTIGRSEIISFPMLIPFAHFFPAR